MRKLTIWFTAIFTLSVVIYGCKKEYFAFDKLNLPQWDPNFAVPLINSSVTISDIIEQADAITPYTIIEADSSVTIVYAGNVFSAEAFEVVDIADFNADVGFGLSSSEITTFNNTQSVTKDTSFVVPLSINGAERIDEAVLKTGDLNFQVNSYFSHSGTLTIRIPQLIDLNGNEYETTIPLDYNSSLPVSGSAYEGIQGFKLIGSSQGNPNNTIEVIYELSLNNSGNTTFTSDEVEISNTISNISFWEVKGYLGQTVFDLDEDSININLFNNTEIQGGFELVDPTIKVSFRNSYGVPFAINPIRLDAYSEVNGQYSIDGLPGSITVQPAPALGDSATTTYTIDNSNSSNVDQLISSQSKWVIYEFDGQPNPDGEVQQNFATDSSHLTVDIDVEIPLDGRAWDFVLQDTFDFAFEEEIDEVEWAMFRLNINNGFPLDAITQLYFADSNYTYIDSLVNPLEPLIVSGAIGQNNIVSSPTRTINDYMIEGDRISNLVNAKYMVLKADLETANAGQTQVKVYSYYKMDIRLGLQVQLNFDPDEL